MTVATVSLTVGLVTGTGPGTATITYTYTGCTAVKSITVNPTSPITGPATVCVSASVTLSDALGGGTWTSGSTTVASVGLSSGIVTGLTTGTAKITYTLAVTGCAVTMTETVNPLPAAITGFDYICIGAATTLSDATTGGSWSSGNTSIATVGSGTGIVSGSTVGAADITYTLAATGCVAVQTVTVSPLPFADTVNGGGGYCAGGTGVHIYLDSSEAGTNYFLHIGGSIAGIVSGSGTVLDFGLQTLVGAYTVTATNTTTGCKATMTDTAFVTTIPVVIPSVTITVSTGDTICAGTISLFHATTVHGGSTPVYQWEVNGSLVGIDTVDYSFGPANGDVVTVTVVSNEVCAIPDTVTDTVIMYVAPHKLPSVTLHATPGDTICYGNAVTIIPTPSYGGPTPIYNYYKNGVHVGTGNHYAFLPVGGDTVYCYMISDYFCRLADTAFEKIGVTVDTPVMPYFIITANPPVLTGPGMFDTLSVILSDTSGPFHYQWTVNDSNIHGATNSTYVSDSFNYMKDDSVTCTVTHLGICRLTTFNWILVPNNVGVKQINAANIDISVVPNPNKGEFIVRGTLGTNRDETVSIEITDMMGRVVHQTNFMARDGNINEKIHIGNILTNGMYLLNVRSEAANKVFHIVVEQ